MQQKTISLDHAIRKHPEFIEPFTTIEWIVSVNSQGKKIFQRRSAGSLCVLRILFNTKHNIQTIGTYNSVNLAYVLNETVTSWILTQIFEMLYTILHIEADAINVTNKGNVQ